MAAAFDMEGAFNDVVLTLAPRASQAATIDALDRLLEPWGGLGAYGRGEQTSNRFLDDEIEQQRVMATTVPAIFLGVAAFLLNVVLGRLVAAQREQIATLKALGYPTGRSSSTTSRSSPSSCWWVRWRGWRSGAGSARA